MSRDICCHYNLLVHQFVWDPKPRSTAKDTFSASAVLSFTPTATYL